MTDIELTTLSTACWVIATVTLFVLLAEWSNGGSWGLTASIVHGVRGWSGPGRAASTVTSPSVEPLRQILDPYAFVRRSTPDAAPAEATFGAVEAPEAFGALWAPETSGAEVIDLGERHIPG